MRRSWITAWNVDSAKTSFFQGCGLSTMSSNASSVKSLNVRFMLARTPFGRLVRELDAVLQHQDGENLRGHGREPQPEVVVRCWCPRRWSRPSSPAKASTTSRGGSSAGTPSRRVRPSPSAPPRSGPGPARGRPSCRLHRPAPSPASSRSCSRSRGVGARGQHEDDRRAAAGVGNVVQGPGRRLGEALAHLDAHVLAAPPKAVFSSAEHLDKSSFWKAVARASVSPGSAAWNGNESGEPAAPSTPSRTPESAAGARARGRRRRASALSTKVPLLGGEPVAGMSGSASVGSMCSAAAGRAPTRTA